MFELGLVIDYKSKMSGKLKNMKVAVTNHTPSNNFCNMLRLALK